MGNPNRFGGVGPKKRTEKRVNFELVEKAVASLLADREKITIEAVHKKLGFGSLTTISRYLKEWEKMKHEKFANGELVGGDDGAAYLVSKAFLSSPPSGTRVCSLVLNGLHFLLDEAEAEKFVEAADKFLSDKTESDQLRDLRGETVLSLKLAAPVKFTGSPELVERLRDDLRIALKNK